jgi:putative oxidoreductase
MNADEKSVATANPRTARPLPIHHSRNRDEVIFFLTRWVDAPARAFMSLLFLVSGVSKVTAVAAIQGYMEAYGVPGILIWPAAAWEIGAGILLLIGLGTRPLAVGLAGWCVLTAFIFHTAFADLDQLMNFFKNFTMAGGFLLIAKTGASGLSIESWLSARKRIQ